jgi:hypothetical protein
MLHGCNHNKSPDGFAIRGFVVFELQLQSSSRSHCLLMRQLCSLALNVFVREINYF